MFNNKLMRAVVRVFLILWTKSIWENLTYKKLAEGKLFIYMYEEFLYKIRNYY